MHRKFFVLFPLLLIGVGCNHWAGSAVSDPSTVTLEDALGQVGTGMRNMYVNSRGGDVGTVTAANMKPFGLSVRECEVTFNITAGSEKTINKKLVVDLSVTPPTPVPISGKANAEAGMTEVYKASRGNTITIKFLNPAFAPPDTLIHDAKDGDTFVNLISGVQRVQEQFKPEAEVTGSNEGAIEGTGTAATNGGVRRASTTQPSP